MYGWSETLRISRAICVRRQDNIDKTGTNGAARHRIELCAGFSLREGQTAGRLDRTQTGCPVAAGSGKHDPDRS